MAEVFIINLAVILKNGIIKGRWCDIECSFDVSLFVAATYCVILNATLARAAIHPRECIWIVEEVGKWERGGGCEGLGDLSR